MPTGALILRPGDSLAIVTKNKWGWLPTLSLVGALGLLSVAFGYSLARNGAEWAPVLFWFGLLMIFAPIAARLLHSEADRAERIGLVGVMGLGLYLVKVLHSPLNFTYHDEFVHTRTVTNILNSNHLFQENPTIPVSPLYPGMHIITDALSSMSGLDVYAAGLIVMGLARLLIVIALYMLYEEISGSQRIAGIATIIYMANPTFLFFNAQFAYESLALPLATLTLFAVARRNGLTGSRRLTINLLVILGALSVVTTHHLTTYALIAFLGIWAAFSFGVKFFAAKNGSNTAPVATSRLGALWQRFGPEASGSNPGGAAVLTIVASITWLVQVANFTVGYLAPVLREAIIEIVRLILGEASGRQLFKGSTGQVAPLWEQLTGFGAVGLLLLALPFGLLFVWKNLRHTPLALALAFAALAYPASLAMRLTTAGWEVSNRTSEFVFVAVAFVVACGINKVWEMGRAGAKWTVPLVAVMSVIFLGGVIVGWPPAARLPGTYLVSADTRSIEPQGIAMARWSKDNLGVNNRIAADRINGLLMLSYGQQHTVMNVGDGVNVGPLFISNEFGKTQQEVLDRGRISYIVVDYRMTRDLPLLGIYFENGEPNSGQHKKPIDPAMLAKYDNIPGVRRVFDSGDIIIYDVRELNRVR